MSSPVAGLTTDAVRARVAAGQRLVRFEFCFSGLFFTVRRQTAVRFTRSRFDRMLHGLGYSIAALALGPWGVPWGLVWTPWTIWVNLTGGVDETESVLDRLGERDNPTL